MGSSWFRLYSEIRTDPKMRTMSDTMQIRFIYLMCLQCENNLHKLREYEIAYALGITEEEFQKTKELFLEKNFIYEDDGKIFITNWDKRQFVSDTSKERTKKWREKKQCDVTNASQKSECDVTSPSQNENVTAPDTDTDTDTEEENIKDGVAAPGKDTEQTPPKSDEIIARIVLKDGSRFPVKKSLASELSGLYRDIDVENQFLRLQAWADANPAKRSTPRGIKKRYTAWMSFAQSKAENSGKQVKNNFGDGRSREFDVE